MRWPTGKSQDGTWDFAPPPLRVCSFFPKDAVAVKQKSDRGLPPASVVIINIVPGDKKTPPHFSPPGFSNFCDFFPIGTA